MTKRMSLTIWKIIQRGAVVGTGSTADNAWIAAYEAQGENWDADGAEAVEFDNA